MGSDHEYFDYVEHSRGRDLRRHWEHHSRSPSPSRGTNKSHEDVVEIVKGVRWAPRAEDWVEVEVVSGDQAK